MLSHHEAPMPASPALGTMATKHSNTRRHRSSRYRTSSPSSSSSSASSLLCLSILLILAALLGTAEARVAHLRDRQQRAPFPAVLVESFDLDEPTWRGSALLAVDTRPPPPAPSLMPPHHDELPTKVLAAPLSKRSDSFEIPTPFDTSLSNNFTSNCANFFTKMLTSTTVTTCHPFSLMLQTSSALFDASKSFVRITQTLEATCAANMTQCLVGMNSLARELKTNAACGVDYANNNAQAVQAYNGLVAYEPLYRASCLRDDDGNFCYANAVTNATTQGVDANPYYMPLGMKLVSGKPTCDSCLQDTMAIFSTFAGNASQPLSLTYPAGANLISVYCGQNFINVTAAPMKANMAPSTTAAAAYAPTISLFLMLFFYLFD